MINNSQSRTDRAKLSAAIKKPLVLVVKKQPDIRFVLRKWLETHGINVAEAKSGEEGVEHWRKSTTQRIQLRKAA